MKEIDIQIEIATWAKSMEAVIPELKRLHHSPNGDLRHVVVAKRLKDSGTKKGFPDFFLPVSRGLFKGFFMEVKLPGEKLSANQEEWMWFLFEEGYYTCVVYSTKYGVAQLLSYLREVELETIITTINNDK